MRIAWSIHEFQTSQGYSVRPCLKQQQTTTKKNKTKEKRLYYGIYQITDNISSWILIEGRLANILRNNFARLVTVQLFLKAKFGSNPNVHK